MEQHETLVSYNRVFLKGKLSCDPILQYVGMGPKRHPIYGGYDSVPVLFFELAIEKKAPVPCFIVVDTWDSTVAFSDEKLYVEHFNVCQSCSSTIRPGDKLLGCSEDLFMDSLENVVIDTCAFCREDCSNRGGTYFEQAACIHVGSDYHGDVCCSWGTVVAMSTEVAPFRNAHSDLGIPMHVNGYLSKDTVVFVEGKFTEVEWEWERELRVAACGVHLCGDNRAAHIEVEAGSLLSP